MSDQDFSKLKVAELREMLKSKGLNSVGNKQELIDRLQTATSESSGDLDHQLEDDLLNDDELEEEKSLLDGSHDDILKSPESAKSTSPENSTVQPTKKVSLKRNISVTVPVIESKSEDEAPQSSENSSSEPEKKVIKISQLTAKDRLELRAKKFAGADIAPSAGSQDRLQARAARFGIAADEKSSTAKAITTTVPAEILKKRAERFGAVIPELKNSELKEKISKRQERFGTAEKVAITAPGVKSEYAEKALKRLERFKPTV